MAGKLRIAAAWLFALPFFLLARPTLTALLVGACVTALGVLTRGWAAGSVDKGAALTTRGPYAYTRNPLYLGSFMIGLGITVAGGSWTWPAAFVAFFFALYVPTVRREAVELAERFGSRYLEYAAEVPAIGVRMTPYRAEAESAPDTSQRPAFEWGRYLRYREWEALLGAAAATGVLALKLRLGG